MRVTPTTFFTLILTGAMAGIGVTTVPGCDSGSVCGECGQLETGQVSISGDARLDGLFGAVVRLRTTTARVRADFEAEVLALADVYGVAPGEVDDAFVADLVATIEADIDQHAEAGLRIAYQSPRCEASVSAAVEAQAACEAQAGCEVDVDPGRVDVRCEGTCTGECTGTCSGALSCAIEAPAVACEGACEGTCELEVAGPCDGVCKGECVDGDCRAKCEGTCELSGRAGCGGTCHGTCYVEQGSAQCQAGAECAGSCDAECSGSCEGSFEPPSAPADCEASADCEAQARAQANASLECSPPSLTFAFDLRADLDASAEAAFRARLAELRVRGAAILQGTARMRALVEGTVDGEIVFEPAPLAEVGAQLKGLGDAVLDGELDIPAGRIACVGDAIDDAVRITADISSETSATLRAQGEFAVLFAD